ncbi:hypothetical protein AMECASPLE_019528 [Ameca splendens]|uniref:Secreted protein n=1 Tax=Ameca splendens TaxID=208324 RepID=A0ABV0YEC4_9TELE
MSVCVINVFSLCLPSCKDVTCEVTETFPLPALSRSVSYFLSNKEELFSVPYCCSPLTLSFLHAVVHISCRHTESLSPSPGLWDKCYHLPNRCAALIFYHLGK